jgi:Asp-tRNA(Asn)/Glu-tRNA(Gln) amidotransferase B subunit
MSQCPLHPASPVQSTMPELPAARRERYASLGLPPQDVVQLTDEPGVARMFDSVLVGEGSQQCGLPVAWLASSIRASLAHLDCLLYSQAAGVAPKMAANWLCGDIQAYCKVGAGIQHTGV